MGMDGDGQMVQDFMDSTNDGEFTNTIYTLLANGNNVWQQRTR